MAERVDHVLVDKKRLKQAEVVRRVQEEVGGAPARRRNSRGAWCEPPCYSLTLPENGRGIGDARPCCMSWRTA